MDSKVKTSQIIQTTWDSVWDERISKINRYDIAHRRYDFSNR